MRTLATAIAAATLFAVSLGAQAGKLSGRRAPSFALPDLNMNYHDILDYRGKVLILEIVKTDCPVCGSFQKIVQRVELAYGDRVGVLTIVNPPDNQTTVQGWVTGFNIKTPVLFDIGQVSAVYMKATPQNPTISLPHVFLIDGKGTIRNDYAYETGTTQFFETLDPLMKEVGALVKELGGSAPATSKGGK